jgi:hypothetical protein
MTFQKEYGVATIDGHDEKIGNFRIEPPGLFRGRGEHPKQVSLAISTYSVLTTFADCWLIWIRQQTIVAIANET